MVGEDGDGPSDALRDTPVSTVAIANAPYARPDTGIGELREIFQKQELPVPVVEADGTLVGIVRPGDVKDDLPRDAPNGIERGRAPMVVDDAGARPLRRAADAMMALVFYVPSDASLARATALLVEESVTYAPLVSADGKYAGMIDGLALLRWFARTRGYLVPEPSSTAGLRRGSVKTR